MLVNFATESCGNVAIFYKSARRRQSEDVSNPSGGNRKIILARRRFCGNIYKTLRYCGNKQKAGDIGERGNFGESITGNQLGAEFRETNQRRNGNLG